MGGHGDGLVHAITLRLETGHLLTGLSAKMAPCVPTDSWRSSSCSRRAARSRPPRWPRSSRSPSGPHAATSTRWGWPGSPCTRSRAAAADGGWPGRGRTDLSGLNDWRGPGAVPAGRVGRRRDRPRCGPRCASSCRHCPTVQRERASRATRAHAGGRPERLEPAPRRHAGHRHRARRGSSEAVVERRADPHRTRRPQAARSSRVVHPLGLATKRRHWYLLTDTDDGPRTFRVDRIDGRRADRRARPRPDEFDLEQRWAEVLDRLDGLRAPIVARGVADVAATRSRSLGDVFGSRLVVTSANGRSPAATIAEVEIRGHSVDVAGRTSSPPFGGSIRIESPTGDALSALAPLGPRPGRPTPTTGPADPTAVARLVARFF